jgi:hypothetical protein
VADGDGTIVSAYCLFRRRRASVNCARFGHADNQNQGEFVMKFAKSLTLMFAATLSAASAFAADKAPANTLTPQQQKMSDCSKDAHAKSLQGDEYKTYMSTCMKAAPAATTPAAATTTDTTKAADASKTNTDTQWVATNPQQQKMKACATDAKAKGLKGPDRRTYMSTCLKKDSTATTTPAATPAK